MANSFHFEEAGRLEGKFESSMPHCSPNQTPALCKILSAAIIPAKAVDLILKQEHLSIAANTSG